VVCRGGKIDSKKMKKSGDSEIRKKSRLGIGGLSDFGIIEGKSEREKGKGGRQEKRGELSRSGRPSLLS